ncbi:hypothetical protein [Mycobacterium sp.]|uniref:hypothetical protein n=1 Tax=Mycobacterium sp. TaxID=1785 RepID=UPI0031E1D60D
MLVTIGSRHRTPVREPLRSPAVFEWCGLIGVDDAPAFFAGAVVQKIDLETGEIAGAVSTVDDFSEMMATVRRGLDCTP